MSDSSIYQHLLGPAWMMLPDELRRFHSSSGRTRFSGSATVLAAETLAGKLVAGILGLPRRSGDVELGFLLDANATREIWVRNFSGHVMRSTLTMRDGLLCETLGPVTLLTALQHDDGILRMRVTTVRFLGMPVPAALVPTVIAEETAGAGRLHFAIDVRWPLIGRLVGYRGHINLDTATVTT